MAAVSGPVGCLSFCLFRGMAAVQVQQLAAPVGQGGQAGPRRPSGRRVEKLFTNPRQPKLTV